MQRIHNIAPAQKKKIDMAKHIYTLWKGLNIDGALQETSASHLHLGDFRDWGGLASAASDASLTCLATSWRHQDVNEEEQGVSLDMVILDLCQHNFSDKYSYKITP